LYRGHILPCSYSPSDDEWCVMKDKKVSQNSVIIFVHICTKPKHFSRLKVNTTLATLKSLLNQAFDNI